MPASAVTNPLSAPKPGSLEDELVQALPSGLRCKIRYLHTRSKPCDPLFSALPGQTPEKTRLTSHFLTASVDSTTLGHQSNGSTGSERNRNGDVISFAIEVLIYTSRRLTTIFVSKVDSTSYIPRHRPSPIQTTVTTFLKWLSLKEKQKHNHRKIVISLFARAQAQYLFPGSADSKQKHVLDDRQLIKWWAKTLDPIITSTKDYKTQYQGYMTVPGYAGNELRSFKPGPDSQARWLSGHPLMELARTRGLPEHAPPRCLLPRFPDDPKARFIMDLDEDIGLAQDSEVTVSPSKCKSGRWNSVSDLKRFWEAMEFRQECSSGRAVGFLWLVIGSKQDEDDGLHLRNGAGESQDSFASALSSDPASQESAPDAADRARKRKRRVKLTGPVIPRQPRLKGGSSSLSNLSEVQADQSAGPLNHIIISKEGYDKAMQTLLNLDFSTLESATASTAKWLSAVISVAALKGDFACTIEGTAKTNGVATNGAPDGSSAVNDLGGMLIRKKRKATDSVETESQDVVEKKDTPIDLAQPAVNVLGSGMVRKKQKPALT